MSDPDRRVWLWLYAIGALFAIVVLLAECAGYDAVRVGTPVDSETRWRERAR